MRKRSFRCKDCGLEYNQDLNGAINIGNRLLNYMLKSRAAVNTPQTSPENTAPKKGDLITFQSAREEAPCKSWE
ncbi:MAG: zinc ribbon domain-containing protein [Candidatus Hodarchaeota archaeon]